MVARRIFLAGASGAVGMRLTTLLREAGHLVIGTTRSAKKADALLALGALPCVVDVFEAESLSRAVREARPDVVINQLTDLPKDLDPAKMQEAIVRNARVREEGTRNLVAAAHAAGARRMIAQSIAWAYAPGMEPHSESDPLDTNAQGGRAITIRGVVALEELTLRSPPLEGIVLRYGQLYGPGTHADVPSTSAPVHVDAAAHAALLAVERGAPGAFNIAQPNSYVTTTKALRELGWSPGFRRPADYAADR